MPTYITAHSGCEGTGRDSLESIDRALAVGADAIEIDVRLADNGVLRVSHNALTNEEYEEKPLVSDAFARIADTKLMINCDLKEQKALYPLLALAKEYGLTKDRLILTGCASIETLLRDPALTRQAQVFINFEEVVKYYCIGHLGIDTPDGLKTLLDDPWSLIKEHQELLNAHMLGFLLSWCRTLGVAGLNTNYLTVTPASAAACKQAGVDLSVWTVNDIDIAKPLFDMGVWNVTTVTPAALMAVRG